MRSDPITNLYRGNPQLRPFLKWGVTLGSILLCLLLLPSRLPGMELMGIGPNWLLIWVVAWSIKRTTWQGVTVGLALGLLQDGMSAPLPTHAIGLALVGYLTARLQKQRFVQEDFISVALVVFGMSVLVATITALQFSVIGDRTLEEIWTFHQRIALCSAILSSLWAPVLYFPLNLWWEKMGLLEQH